MTLRHTVETVGYIGRAITATDKNGDGSKNTYIMQSLLILVGPPFFASCIYMILGRIIRLTNVGGGGILAKADSASSQRMGEHVIIAGLFIYVFLFGFFIIASGLFHCRIEGYPTTRSRAVNVSQRRYLCVLFDASVLILWSSIYRVAEYIQGAQGSLPQREVYPYVFDATLMFLPCVIFNIFHPSSIISHKSLEEVPQEMECTN